jgi:hypothetical protein
MNSRFFYPRVLLSILTAVLALSVSCGPRSEHPDGNTINYSGALNISDQVANDLIQDDSHDLFKVLDEGFTTRVNSVEELEKVLQTMYKQYGKPTFVQLKASQAGYRADGPHERPRRSFWYACATTKYQIGQYFIKVEVVPALDYDRLVTSGFGIIDYPQGVPNYLK